MNNKGLLKTIEWLQLVSAATLLIMGILMGYDKYISKAGVLWFQDGFIAALGTYVFFLGARHFIRRTRINLAYFYMIFGVMMIISVVVV